LAKAQTVLELDVLELVTVMQFLSLV